MTRLFLTMTALALVACGSADTAPEETARVLSEPGERITPVPDGLVEVVDYDAQGDEVYSYLTEAEMDAMVDAQMASEPVFLDPGTLTRDMFAESLVAIDGIETVEQSEDMTRLMTDIVAEHSGDAGVREVFAGDGRTIVFLDESFTSGPVATRETYAEFLPVGPLSNRLEYVGARVKCRGAADFQLEPCP